MEVSTAYETNTHTLKKNNTSKISKWILKDLFVNNEINKRDGINTFFVFVGGGGGGIQCLFL